MNTEPKNIQKKSTKQFLIALTIFSLILTVGVIATRISDQTNAYFTADNITINNSGAYYGGEKAFTKTADITICKSTDINDHGKKIFNCDVICAYNDLDASCNSKVNSSIQGKNLIHFSGGEFNITSLSLYNNQIIEGEGKGNTVLNKVGSGYMFIIKSNITFRDLKIDGKGDADDIIYNNEAHYLYVDNSIFDNLGSKAISSGTAGISKGGIIENSEFYNYYSNDDFIAISAIDNLIIRGNKFIRNNTGSGLTSNSWKNTQIYNNYFQSNDPINNGLSGELTSYENVIVQGNNFVNSSLSFGSLASNGSYKKYIDISSNILNGGRITLATINSQINITGVKVHDNILINPYYQGISIADAWGCEIYDNSLYENNLLNSTSNYRSSIYLLNTYDCSIINNKIYLYRDDTASPYISKTGIFLEDSNYTSLKNNQFYYSSSNKVKYALSNSYFTDFKDNNKINYSTQGISTDNLIFYSTGSDTADYSGNGNNCTLRGTATYTNSGKFGKGLVMNGVANGDLSCGNNSNLNLDTNPFTILMWVNPKDITGVGLLDKGALSGTAAGFKFVIDANSLVSLSLGNGTARDTYTISNQKVLANTWNMVGLVSDRNTATGFTNGVFGVSADVSKYLGQSLNSSTVLSIAGQSNIGWYNGSVDSIMLYNRALSEDEIMSIYLDNKEQIAKQTSPIKKGTLSGTGNRIACLDANGYLYAGNATGCP